MASLQSFFQFLIFSFAFSINFSLSVSVKCNPVDIKALIELQKGLNNPKPVIYSDDNNDCVCNWYCCDQKTGRVIKIEIFNGDVSAPIPNVIGKLTALESLTLRKLVNLSGEIPPVIRNLKKLTFLRLSWNSLSGPIPAWLSELENLTYLDLAFNKFSGEIPATLGSFQKLEALHLDRNRLTGNIPESFGYFKGTVPYLYLSHNNLSGEIPESLGNMNFDTIDLSRNKLTGDASQIFRGNKSTQIVDLSRNLLEFDLSKVTFPESLTSLDLNHNRIFGEIPTQILKLNWQFLNVSYNMLCGQIPQGKALERFDSSSYIHNKCLCGSPLPIPCK